MNSLVNFRLCTLTDEELLKAVDAKTDELSKAGTFTLPVPARPNEDYDLLVGELVFRFNERLTSTNPWETKARELEEELKECRAGLLRMEEELNNRIEQWKEERKEMREEMRNRD